MTNHSLAHQLITLHLQRQKLTKAGSDYRRLAPGDDGRIRTKLSPSTETGRLASGEDDWWPEPTTNLQNLTNSKKILPKFFPLLNIRECIVPAPGNCLICADLSGAELWTYLAYAGDTAKIDMLLAGEDLHRLTASQIYDIEPAAVTKVQRTVGKFANFSLGYRGGWRMFLSKVNKDADLTGVAIDAKLAKAAVAGWQALNPLTVAWQQSVEDEARSKGELTNAYSRKRVCYGTVQRGGARDLIAFLPQSTIADHLNAGLVRVWHDLDGAGCELRLQVHDEVVLECKLDRWLSVATKLKRLLERPLTVNGITFTIPVEVSMSSQSWAHVEEVKV